MLQMNMETDPTKNKKQLLTKRFKCRIVLVLLSVFLQTIVGSVASGLSFFYFQTLVHCPPGGPTVEPPQEQHHNSLPADHTPSSSALEPPLPSPMVKKHLCMPPSTANNSSNTTAKVGANSTNTGSSYCEDRKYVVTEANNLNGSVGILTLIMRLILAPIFGSCSDKYGRRPFLIMAACCRLFMFISFQLATAFNNVPSGGSGIHPVTYIILVLSMSIAVSFNVFSLMINTMITDVIVRTLPPGGADPASGAAAISSSSLRQQSSQSTRSRSGSTRSRAQSTIEEEITAEQRIGKAVSASMLIGGVANLTAAVITAQISWYPPVSYVPTWFLLCIPSVLVILLACFTPETLAAKVDSTSSSKEEARLIPIRSERSESFALINSVHHNSNGGDDEDYYNMMENDAIGNDVHQPDEHEYKDHQHYQEEEQDEPEQGGEEKGHEEEEEREGNASRKCCSKEWCQSSILGSLIFLSENRQIAYVAVFLFLIGVQLASMEDIQAFMSLDLCLSPREISIITPLQGVIALISIGCAGPLLSKIGALNGMVYAGFISIAGLLLMSFANVSQVFFFAGLLTFSTLAFSQVAYIQFVSARVDPSVIGGVQASLGSIFAMGMLVGKPIFLILFALPSLPNHFLFLIGASIGVFTTSVIVYLKCTMPTKEKNVEREG